MAQQKFVGKVEFSKGLEGVITNETQIGKEAHPMTTLRTAVSALGCFDPKGDEVTVANCTEVGIKLIARMATVAGAISRVRKGKPIIEPDPELGHAANFLYMMNGEKPDDFSVRVMDVSLILHADHGMNASTFTSMVVGSTLSDMYSCVTSGISALKGPLHGGANERALDNLMSVGGPEKVGQYVKKAIERKEKIMGFGHRVYKAYDPRAKVLGKYSKEVTAIHCC